MAEQKKAETVKVATRHRSLGRPAGTVIEVEAAHAEHLIANGNAVPVKSEKD